METFKYPGVKDLTMVDVDAPIKEIAEFKVKYNDVFHLKNLYIMMHEYFADESWTGEYGPSSQPSLTHMDIEKMYMERHHQKAVHRGGKELWVWWRMYKPPMHKFQGYYQFALEVDFHGMYMQKIEIMHQGKKLKVDKGELEIFFRPKIIRMPTGKAWKTHWATKWFQELYEKRIISTDIEKLEKELWREAYRAQATVKSYLNLRNFIPVPEPFHPKLYGMEGQF